MLLQVIARFDATEVNVKDINAGLVAAGVKPEDIRVATAREEKPKRAKAKAKPAPAEVG